VRLIPAFGLGGFASIVDNSPYHKLLPSVAGTSSQDSTCSRAKIPAIERSAFVDNSPYHKL